MDAVAAAIAAAEVAAHPGKIDPRNHIKVSTQMASNLYAMLPRNLRLRLYDLMMADETCPFRDGPDDSPAGRWFAIATGDYKAPAAHLQLDEIVNQLPLSDVQKEQMFKTYIKHLKPLIMNYIATQ